MTDSQPLVRIAAVGDVHCGASSHGAFAPLFKKINDAADVLLLCGDLTNYGLPEEAKVFVKEIAGLKIPILAVLGNHDYESGHQDQVVQILTDSGITILDPGPVEFNGVGFAGVKGFGGGFGRRALQPWGESLFKNFVQETIDESLKLETALAKLRTSERIVVLHYSPIQATVEGEPPEIFPFLGSSRLEEPINRYRVTAVFHGHAHYGSLQGWTRNRIPVYNVALPLLQKIQSDPFPVHMIEIRLGSGLSTRENAPVA